MKRIVVLILVLLASAVQVEAIYFRHLSTRDGLSQNSVMSIYQDELGRMWFGTEEGVSMYDGKSVVRFKHSDQGVDGGELPMGNETFPITGDGAGNIYFCSDQMLLHYSMRRETFECVRSSGIATIYCHDSHLLVGAADSVYRYHPDSGQMEFLFASGAKTISITKIYIDSKQQMWIGTRSGLFVVAPDGRLREVVPDRDIYELMEDSQSNLWIATRTEGLFKRSKEGILTRYVHRRDDQQSIAHNQIRSFAEDDYGNIWIGTFLGLCRYDPATDGFVTYRKDNLPGSLHNSSVFSTFKDKQGTIWIGTYYGGVHYFNPHTDLFSYHSDDRSRNDCLSHFFVGNIAEDESGNLWICTEGGGLNFFDRTSGKFTYYMTDRSHSDVNAIAHNNIKCIAFDSKRNRLYIGTHTGGLSVFDTATKRFDNFVTNHPELHQTIGNIITNVALIDNQYLIVNANRGLFKLDLDDYSIEQMLVDGRQMMYDNVRVDRSNRVWTARHNGIYCFDSRSTVGKLRFSSGERGLGQSAPYALFFDRNDRMYVGTLGSGLFGYDSQTDSFVPYTVQNGLLQGNYCYNIAQSQNGQIVVMTDKGLAFIDVENQHSRFVDLSVLPVAGFNKGCGLLVCTNSQIVAGSVSGLIAFYDTDLFDTPLDYDIYFSSLTVNDEPVAPNDRSRILRESLPYTDRLVLSHKQNNLIFRFSSNNYTNTPSCALYQYRLEGVDNRWYSNDSGQITYTNLRPGRYRLVVREMSERESEEKKQIAMQIVIRSPWYANTVAYVFYVLIVCAIAIFIFRSRRQKLLLQTKLEIERSGREHVEQLNQQKLQFFSNISHEFRTPLTLIIAQIDNILQNSRMQPSVYNRLLRVNKNAQQLQNLVSELLDFRKLEQNHVLLKVANHNIVPFIQQIYLSFGELASSRNVSYRFTASNNSIECMFDPNQMQKVFYNLLSNAFKFTDNNASIEVNVSQTDTSVTVRVIDNGRGIAKENLDRIFERFYSVGNSSTNLADQPSTGIGLAIVKGITLLHHGTVEVESTVGCGTVFTVTLLKGSDHFAPDQIADTGRSNFVQAVSIDTDSPPLESASPAVSVATEVNKTDTDAQSSDQTADRTQDLQPQSDDTQRKVLLVEDNEELLTILCEIFAPLYTVSTARDGAEGVEVARSEMPDLIVSDIMMPTMTGTEMCMKLKNDFDTCHIPIVLLTALTSVEQSIDGLHRGADDYIGKPFNIEALLARCNNLVRNRAILKKKFAGQSDFNLQSLANNPIDQKFLDTVNTIIERNFDNPDFDSNMLASELAVSRSSLYAKFKSLTGLTPNDFVMNRKMARAAFLLRNRPQMQIAEIAYSLAFGSPRYFSRCFKEQFGCPPAEYRKGE